MATFLLDGKRSALLPRRPLVVTVSMSGGPASAVRLSAIMQDRTQADFIARPPATIIVPRVEGRITIRAVPGAGGDTFAENVVLHLSVRPDAPPGAEVDSVQLAPREVAGRTYVDLVTVEPGVAEQLVVSSMGGSGGLKLPPLASRARVACQGALGVDSIATERLLDFACVVDPSFSMASLVDNGTLRAASDLVAGVAAVIMGEQCRVVIANDDLTEVPLDQIGELSTKVSESLQQSGFGVGADIEAAIVRVAPPIGFTVVITDGAGRAPTALTSHVQWMLLSASTQGYPGFSGARLPPPPEGVPAESFYNANPHLIDGAVAALVAPLRAQGLGQ